MLYPLYMRKCHFKRKILTTFKGINFQLFQEHLIHINVLEVNAFRGTAQAVGKGFPFIKWFLFKGRKGVPTLANMPGAVATLPLKLSLNS